MFEYIFHIAPTRWHSFLLVEIHTLYLNLLVTWVDHSLVMAILAHHWLWLRLTLMVYVLAHVRIRLGKHISIIVDVVVVSLIMRGLGNDLLMVSLDILHRVIEATLYVLRSNMLIIVHMELVLVPRCLVVLLAIILLVIMWITSLI